MSIKNRIRHPRRVQVTSASRYGTSANGNPTYYVAFSDGTAARTSTDSSVAYDVENVRISEEWVVPIFTPAGRLVSWERSAEPTLAERMDDAINADATLADPYARNGVELRQLAANWAMVYLPGGGTLWFSYSTVVAAAMPGYGTARTSRTFSKTTSKHLNSTNQTEHAQVLTPAQFAAFVGSVVR